MITLQAAYEILSSKNLSPVYLMKVFPKRNGGFKSVPQSVVFYCPVAFFDEYEQKVLSALPEGFKIAYNLGSELFIIEPSNFTFQFIANQIHTSETAEQIDCCLFFLSSQLYNGTIDGGQFDTLRTILCLKKRLLLLTIK